MIFQRIRVGSSVPEKEHTCERCHTRFSISCQHSGELLEHHGEKLVPYMAQDSVMEITYQVTDVEGPVAAVSSMNDGGMTVVFSPQGAWVCDETPLKPAGSIELKRENRTFWMDLPRADSEQVQRMMALRREQPVEQVEQIAGNPAIEEKRQGIPASANPVVQDNEDTPVARARKPPPGPTADELDKHELTHVVFRSWCKPAVPKRIHTVVLQHMKVALQTSCWIGCFSQAIKNQVFNCRCWLFMTFLLVL